MTKYLVSGYVGFDNFGDEAIVSILAKHLRTLNPEKITWISSNPQKTSQTYNVFTVGMLDFINAVNECDVLISGGGSLLQDITSLKSLFYYLAIIMYAIYKNKKVFIFSQGFAPFRTKIGEILTKFVLRRCDYISVRDKESKKLLNDWEIDAELIADPVWGIEVNKKAQNGIGVQLRSFPTLTKDFLDKLALSIANNFKGQEIKLISLQDFSDIPVLEYFQSVLEQNGMKSKIVKNLSIDDAIDEISSLEYLIGMRFHSCLIAAKAGVKVFGINYDKKVEELSKEVGFPLIELNTCFKDNTFDSIFQIQVEKYNIPKTNFPNFFI